MAERAPINVTTRGIQQLLIAPIRAVRPITLEPKGVVYTKRWVVELLLDLAGYSSDSNLVDATAVEPAAGDGAFLGPMIERLTDSCQRLGRPLSDCKDSLVAYELDHASADQARTIAIDVLTKRGVKQTLAERLASGWVRASDYLLEAVSLEADFVIGNPPYVRLEDIPEETASLYRKAYTTMGGRADLYVAFFEGALRQLKESGVCAFICADRWMRNQYGTRLRELVTSAYSVELVMEMHDADAFHNEVDAYPAITIIRRAKQGSTIVASAGKEAENLKSQRLSAMLISTREPKPLDLPPQAVRAAIIGTWSKGAEPWPCQSPEELILLRRLEDQFAALEETATVGIGVATGNDRVFITKDADLVEHSRLLKLAISDDLTAGKLKWSGHYLVDPWNNRGLVDLEKYPRLRAYFDKHSMSLKKRHTAKNKSEGWYKTIDRVNHALTAKPKLYIPDIKNALAPVLDEGQTYPHHNLYVIHSEEWDLEVLGGLLISAVAQFFVESYAVRMRGGYWRFQAQYLRRIRVPDPCTLSPDQSKELVRSFRQRDRQKATRIALELYKISPHEAALLSNLSF